MKPQALVVFGREPVPGRVKTRLAARIGVEQACRVYRHLLELTLETGSEVDSDRYLYLPESDQWRLPTGYQLGIQRGRDLGKRIENAFQELFALGYERVVLVGSDCPYLTARHLNQAFRALRETETVFGPAKDGGYYLVGQTSPGRDLFSAIPWSTPAVWETTIQRLAAYGWSWRVLKTLEDIDDLAALKRFQETLSVESTTD